MSPPLADTLATVHDSIVAAAGRAGRDPSEVELVAVSKTHAPEAVAEALEAGQTVFGESRVQEARGKISHVSSRARWHFIGHLQSNKIRHALPLYELFHGIDSLALAREIDRLAADAGLFPRVLLEVNVAGEGSKYGFTPESLRRDLDPLLGLSRLQIEGLMTIAPLAPEPEASRPHFAALHNLRDELAAAAGVPLPQLSMGMSGDFEIAIEEGATLVRVGRAIFGPRPRK